MKLINQKSISSGEYSPGFKPGTPFLIEGCVIIQCLKGSASFKLDFKEFEIQQGDVVFLFNNMVIELGERSRDFTIRYVSVTYEFAFKIYVNITSKKFWNKLYLNPVQTLRKDYKEQFDRWIQQCIMVQNLCREKTADTVISNSVMSLFYVMEDIINDSTEDSTTTAYSPQWKLIGDFCILLSRNYMTEHKVSFYAEALNITADYLSVLMKEYFGKNPKETIEDKLVLAMKALLESTNMSVKNITDRLHYEDSSHLCKVFKRHTGMSPGQYRKSLIKQT